MANKYELHPDVGPLARDILIHQPKVSVKDAFSLAEDFVKKEYGNRKKFSELSKEDRDAFFKGEL